MPPSQLDLPTPGTPSSNTSASDCHFFLSLPTTKLIITLLVTVPQIPPSMSSSTSTLPVLRYLKILSVLSAPKLTTGLTPSMISLYRNFHFLLLENHPRILYKPHLKFLTPSTRSSGLMRGSRTTEILSLTLF